VFQLAREKAGSPSFYFTPENGKAVTSSRMRLARSQNIIAVAETSDGTLHTTTAQVKGDDRRLRRLARLPCIQIGDGDMVIAHTPRVRVPKDVKTGDIVEIRTLISHEMETGRRIDS
jgi:hypothetical protein